MKDKMEKREYSNWEIIDEALKDNHMKGKMQLSYMAVILSAGTGIASIADGNLKEGAALIGIATTLFGSVMYDFVQTGKENLLKK